jgi:pSer/pThr/pTyr-binding forkhead associated (FHA) protein
VYLKLPHLEVLKDGRRIELVLLSQESLEFGREQGDFLLDDPEVSGAHCQIKFIDGAAHLFDLNSTNGTFVNGEKILKRKLQNNDLLRIGISSFRYLLLDTQTNDNQELVAADENQPKTKHSHDIQNIEMGSTSLSKQDFLDFSILQSLFSDKKISEESLKFFEAIDEEILCERKKLRISFECHSTQKGKETFVSIEDNFLCGRLSRQGHFASDEELSRRHAELHIDENGELRIKDLGSTNGTFLNESLLEGEKKLKPTDVVRLGKSKFSAWVVSH